MARKYSSENNNCRVVVRYQEDGAGPHQKGELLDYLDSEFELRGWMRVPQPPQSPILNTKDACVFPAMSKRVSAEQGLALGSLSAEKDKLWEIITKVWNDFPLHVIARSYAAHPQFVNAVHSCEGGDKFTKDEKAMHVGARQHFVPVYDHHAGDENGDARGKPVGVVSVDCLDDIAHEVLEKRKLRYERPVVADLDPSRFLNGQELRVIGKYVDPDTFGEWDTYAESVAGAMFTD